MKAPGFKLIDKYIILKFIGTYFYAIALIISVAVIFDVAEKIDDFMEKEAPLRAIVFDYYMNFIPYFANLFSALFTFIAVIFFTSRMAYNTEIVAILSSGVSFKRLMYPYFMGAFIIAALTLILNLFVIPPANRVKLEFEAQYIKNPYVNSNQDIHRQILPGTFVYIESFSTSNQIAYKFSLEKFENGVMKSKLVTDYARWDTIKNKWVLYNYYQRDINGENEVITSGWEKDTTLNITGKDFSRRSTDIEAMNYFELNEHIATQRLQGADNMEEILVEKYRRFADPFSTFILTLIGVALSSRKVRGGIGLHIGIGLLLSFSYILFMRFSMMFAIGGGLNPILAVWLPNIIFLGVGVILYRLAPK